MNFDFRSVLTPRALAGAVGVAVVLLILAFTWLAFSAAPQPDPASLMAAVTVISAPTSTPLPAAVATLDPYASTPTPTLAPDQIGVGAYVQISGTEGQGLRLRSAPGLNGDQLFLGYDAEVFIVQDGPREADGYTWWYLVSNYDKNRAGWAASNFLTVIPPPSQ
jgi:hypothetical protein